MKIAFYTPKLNIGGVEQSFVTLANLLCGHGNKIDFVICQKGILTSELLDNVNLICFNKNKSRQALILMVKYIKDNKPKCIITGSNFHNEFVIIANLLAGNISKVICTQHNYYNNEFDDLKLYKRIYKLAIKILYPLAHSVIAVSDGIEEWMKTISKKIKPKRIYNPFNIERIKSEANTEAKIDNVLPKHYILYAGRFVSVKNLELLINSFAILNKTFPKYQLVMVGSGIEKTKLSNLSLKLNISDKIIWIGDVPNCYRLIKNAKIVALSSYSEALPSLVIESLIIGKTIVSTPNKGALEILANGRFGYITSSFNDADEFAERMMQAITNPFDDLTLKERVDDFDSEKIIEQYLNVIDRC